MVMSTEPWGLELSDEEVDGRDSSSDFGGSWASAGRGDVSILLSSVCWGSDEGAALDNRMGAGLVLGVRSWMLETACLSTVGTLKGGLAARGDELNERGLIGLGCDVAVADKGVRGISVTELTGASLLMLFCGRESGDGL